MLPVALLAFSGILLGVGSSFSSAAIKEAIPFLDNRLLQYLFMWMTKIGLVAFIYLPVMFAVAIPLGLAREEKGVAGFAGFVGYAAFNLAINFFLTVAGVLGDETERAAYGVKSIIGIESIDTGILGAVIVGIIVAKLHQNTTRSKCQMRWRSSAVRVLCQSFQRLCLAWWACLSRSFGRTLPQALMVLVM